MLGNGIVPDTASSHGAASPHRPKHQINRSISDLSSPTRFHHHHHSSHHHSHHHAHRQQASISKRDDNSAAPSLPPPRPSVDVAISRSEGVTPNITPIPSRRPSILAASGSDDAPSRPPPPVPSAALERRPGKDEDLVIAREKAQAIAAGLQTAVADLNTTSTSTARRLDDAYTSVMDKLGTLSSTAAALEELRDAWRDAADGFSRETDELVADVSGQIDGLGTFDSQRRRIESLQSRIHDGRERIQQLSGRVDAVHDRIEGWERADREWQERTRRRLKTIWVVTSVLVLVLLVFLLVVAGHDVPRQQPHMVGKGEPVASATEPSDWVRSAVVSGHIPAPRGAEGGGPAEAGEHGEDSAPAARLFKSLNQNGRDSRVDADKQLRVFDEL
ncbi:hypothetical protein GGTG_10177 [Gaeumannomyces tritici R3-111a-1]|uniref:Uncharacterized protein n=1 Tax=Gaeumannomyces tritici (strain R3-111a-1) TaxID=644352 RepID=J3P9J7_GAET3|nr:hypothetical protein GGTG_10177 [Gaeumannomyces tritici R3-111a-1]EJT73333.1 hypothetical protein GGTG_10177 [Gaeumannomyces tritici R3-111a-1]